MAPVRPPLPLPPGCPLHHTHILCCASLWYASPQSLQDVSSCHRESQVSYVKPTSSASSRHRHHSQQCNGIAENDNDNNTHHSDNTYQFTAYKHSYCAGHSTKDFNPYTSPKRWVLAEPRPQRPVAKAAELKVLQPHWDRGSLPAGALRHPLNPWARTSCVGTQVPTQL